MNRIQDREEQSLVSALLALNQEKRKKKERLKDKQGGYNTNFAISQHVMGN